MAFYGYARVSTLDQDLTIQRAALKAAGCTVVRAEKASGSRRDGRTELQVLLDFVQPGGTVNLIGCGRNEVPLPSGLPK
jgi:DNA invertase Pin-like site-specific DNA recombinase